MQGCGSLETAAQQQLFSTATVVLPNVSQPPCTGICYAVCGSRMSLARTWLGKLLRCRASIAHIRFRLQLPKRAAGFMTITNTVLFRSGQCPGQCRVAVLHRERQACSDAPCAKTLCHATPLTPRPKTSKRLSEGPSVSNVLPPLLCTSKSKMHRDLVSQQCCMMQNALSQTLPRRTVTRRICRV